MNLASLDLNLLVALDALLTERSVTRAAERLSLSQPAVSGTLARLRSLFEDELLVRDGRAMRPTPFAESLEAPLREALARVEETVFARPAFVPAESERTFTVLATDYMALVLLRPLLVALAVETPNLRVQVEAAGLSALTTRLLRGEVDVVLLPENLTEVTGMPSQRLFEDRFVGAVWREHPDVSDRLELDQLAALPYLNYGRDKIRSNADAHLHGLGIAPTPDATIESFILGAFMLRGTRMVTFLQARLVRELADAAEIMAVEPPVALPQLVEAMCWHPRSGGDPGHVWLRERIARLAAELEDAVGPPAYHRPS
jgi:DNA-binding transcriptional LysR family regulator